ncbi:S46 family peptidase [Roseimarinus sediminis]|uniref:S46 family peptidase n=1 Tax=Roseimarinus sediminis TaxID=1610899 RepID=UPI003D1AC04D
MKIYKVIMLLTAMLSITALQADEGMWLPSLLNKVNVNTMSELGAELSADDIYNINSASLKDAVISLNGGSCTGELVSAEGLFLTNHHCGYGQIQKHSSEEQNILRDGFWAKNHAEELPNKGMFVSFLVRVEDVTAQVLAGLNDEMTEAERADSIRSVSADLESEAVKDTHYEARVKSFFSDNQYLLFVYETFRDVRLVGAPPHFIGKFGGDTDNWMWPRHTGDFSMFRIYAAPDGTPAEYSEENVPMKPRHFFPVSLKGYQENDFAMVMGYPGSTDRYLTSDGVEFTMNVINSTRINLRKAKLDIIREYMAGSDKATIQYASKHARSSNYYKYSIGQNRGLERLGVVAKKEAVEKAFDAWVKQDDERKARYGEALAMIENAYADQNDDKALNYLAEAFLRGPEIFMMARRFQTLEGLLKKDSNEEKIKEETEKLRELAIEYFKDYDAETDRRIVAALTEIFVNDIETRYHPEFISDIRSKYKGDYSKWSEKLFAKSMMNDQAAMMSFLDNPKHKSIAKDPAYQAAIAIFDARSLALEDNKEEQTALTKGYRLFLGGLLEMNNDQQYYPNANSTMRLTYGSIYGYEPRDGVEYNYYTTLSGYIEKEIPGDREFDVWPRLKELYHAGEYGQYASPAGELHTCFISNNDITGGNSGSPVLNKNGELIGIAFDGNWEAMSGDIAFEPELQKCINVDIRYVLWVIDVFAEAGHLVDEMTLVK